MDLNEALYHARLGGAVAFLGSGFSIGAKNRAGNPIPSGRGLRDLLAKEIGISADEDLALVADMFVSQKGQYSLNDLLLKAFTTGNVTAAQKAVLQCPWRRIYTTNYDDVGEFAAKEIGAKIRSVGLDDRPDSQPTTSPLLVHLHGSVAELQGPSRRDPQLSLSSYNASRFNGSAWAPTLRNDLRFASAVFFIGYSLRDLDISRLIYADAEVIAKTFIVIHESASAPERAHLSNFGEVLTFGTDGLASALSKVVITEADKTPLTLVSFTKYSPPLSSRPATQDDYVELLTKGDFRPELFTTDAGHQSPYAVPRMAVASLRSYSEARRVLIHSGLGNGKTVLLDELAQDYASRDYDVYSLRIPTHGVATELDSILSRGRRTCLIFDDFFRNLDVVAHASGRVSPDDVIICTCKTLQKEVDVADIVATLGRDYVEFDLNVLHNKELQFIVDSFNAYGLWGNSSALPNDRKLRILKESCGSEVRSIVLFAFRSSAIAQKLDNWASRIRSVGKDAQRFVLGSILCSLVHGQLSYLDLVDLMGADPRALDAQLKASDASDLILTTGHQIGVRSAILAEHLVQKCFEPAEILDVLVSLITSLTKWLDAGLHIRDLLRNLMRFALLGRLFDSDDRRDFIINFYERLRSNEYCRSNPQFWLQFAMARMDRAEYDLADTLLGTAEARANQLPNYDSFQIENQRAKFLLQSRAEQAKYNDHQTAYIKAAMITNKQMDRARAKVDPYPMRLIIAHERFLVARAHLLDGRTRLMARKILERFEERLESWPQNDYKVEVAEWRISLDSARGALASQLEGER